MKNYTRVFFFSALYTYYLAFFKTYKSSRKTVLGYGFDCLTILSKTESDWNFIMFQNGLTGTFISVASFRGSRTSNLKQNIQIVSSVHWLNQTQVRFQNDFLTLQTKLVISSSFGILQATVNFENLTK